MIGNFQASGLTLAIHLNCTFDESKDLQLYHSPALHESAADENPLSV